MKSTGVKFHRIIPVLAAACLTSVRAQDHPFDPPWDPAPEGYQFTIPGVENVPDLHGEINDPQLVVFFAGNQFMVVDDLLAAFRAEHPEIQRIFLETLPPGVLAKQVETGSVTIGRMKITIAPDVFAAGKSRMDQMKDQFAETSVYACNRLSILVAKGNPQHIRGLADLGRPGVKVSMPNPAWEGVAARIEDAYRKAGGEALCKTIMEDKTRDGSTFLTQIHHRQTPMRVLYGQSEAGPVWHTEAAYQIRLGHPVEEVAIPDNQNIEATYIAGIMKKAPHPEAAKAFYEFLNGPKAAEIYRKYDFMPRKP